MSADGPDQFFVLIFEAARHQYDIELRLLRLQSGHQFEPIKFRHADIENGELRFELDCDGNGIARRSGADDSMCAAQHPFDRAEHARFIIHNQNARRLHHAWDICGTEANGMATSTRVPLPSRLWRLMLPPASQRIERQIVSPRPLPSALVVKTGSGTLGSFSGALPHPGSPIEIFTPSRPWPACAEMC